MRIRVLRPGLLTTVQDLGRTGRQRYGITPGGATDAFALRLANLLVGNDPGAAGLEMTLAGPRLRFEADVLIAVTGGDLMPAVDGRTLPMWHPVRLRAGTTLAFGQARSGCRAYLAVAGGIDVPPVLGSRSTDLRARIGGVGGRALREGDVLATGPAPPLAEGLAAEIPLDDQPFAAAGWMVGGTALAGYRTEPEVRLIRGGHFGRLSAESRERLLGESFRVSADSDRMGYRLEGPPLELEAAGEMITEGVAAGTVQLPAGGRPIILMADRQTTGGYPRIGHVARVDLPVLAQLRPGDTLRFREIGLAEAQALYLERERHIAQVRAAIRLRGR